MIFGQKTSTRHFLASANQQPGVGILVDTEVAVNVVYPTALQNEMAFDIDPAMLSIIQSAVQDAVAEVLRGYDKQVVVNLAWKRS